MSLARVQYAMNRVVTEIRTTYSIYIEYYIDQEMEFNNNVTVDCRWEDNYGIKYNVRQSVTTYQDNYPEILQKEITIRIRSMIEEAYRDRQARMYKEQTDAITEYYQDRHRMFYEGPIYPTKEEDKSNKTKLLL